MQVGYNEKRNKKKMNRVTISVPSDIDLSFRQKAAIKFAFKRGWYGKAIIEAIEFWITHHSDRNAEVGEETKDYLWNKVRDQIKVKSDDPQLIVESVVNHFKNLKFADNIKYEIDENKIFIKKENPLESYAPYLITRENNSIFLNCPVKATATAALKELTGRDYSIRSNENSLLYVYNGSKSLEFIQEKTSAADLSQFL